MKIRFFILFILVAFFACEDDEDVIIPKETLYNFSREPEGANCASGGVKIEEGLDTNDNGVLDPEEVISTSFVCDEVSEPEGKTFVLISGEISNEEASSRIASDVGPNTQVIRIEKTQGLSELEINSPETLIELVVIETDGLTSLKVNGLNRASEIRIEGTGLTEVDLPDLERVELNLNISNNALLTDLDISSLHTSYINTNFRNNGYEVLDLRNLVNLDLLTINHIGSSLKEVKLGAVNEGSIVIDAIFLETIDASQLIEAPHLDLKVNSFSLDFDLSNLISIRSLDLAVQSVDLTSLEAINPNSDFTSLYQLPTLEVENTANVTGLQNLTLVNGDFKIFRSLPALEEVNGQMTIEFGTDGNIAFSSLNYCSRIWVEEDQTAAITTISLEFPELDSTQFISIRNTSLTSLNFPSLTKIDLSSSGNLQIYSNPQLATISFPALVDIGEGQYLFEDNALTVAAVNSLLALLASADPPLTSSVISLNNQNPPASPSGEGIDDLALLLSNGNEVYVD